MHQVRPVTDELVLSKLAEVPLGELRPEFQAQVHRAAQLALQTMPIFMLTECAL